MSEETLATLFGPKLVSSGGQEIETAPALAGKKAIILYFSAGWCPPCRRFTPVLSKAWSEYKNTGGEKEIEVLFVSRDKDEKSFAEYHEKMSFSAVSFGKGDYLADKFGVSGIPSLCVISPEGKVIYHSVDVRGLVGKHGAAAFDLDKFREEEEVEGFFDACMSGDVDVVKARLEAYPDISNRECPQDWHYRYIRRGGWQPVGGDNPGVKNASGSMYLISNFPAYGLHLATGNGHTEIVRLLLEAGAKLDAADGDGDTALTWATWCGRTAIMEQLLNAGADTSFAESISRAQFEGMKGDGPSLDWLKQKKKDYAASSAPR